MKRRPSTSYPGLPYQAFLFEPLGEDRNGAPLALASILGRMSLDPWNEAALLAALPVDVAAKKLAAMMVALPDRLYSHLQSTTLAERLVKLLPAGGDLPCAEPVLKPVSDGQAKRRLLAFLSLIAVACVILASFTFA
jgi:hypothetical protein